MSKLNVFSYKKKPTFEPFYPDILQNDKQKSQIQCPVDQQASSEEYHRTEADVV